LWELIYPMQQALPLPQSIRETGQQLLPISATEAPQREIFMRGLIWQASSNFLLYLSARTINGRYLCRGRDNPHQKPLLKRRVRMDLRAYRLTAMTSLLFIRQQRMPWKKRSLAEDLPLSNVLPTGCRI